MPTPHVERVRYGDRRHTRGLSFTRGRRLGDHRRRQQLDRLRHHRCARRSGRSGGVLVANQHLEIDRAHRPPSRDLQEPTVLAGWTATLVRTLQEWGYDGNAMARAAGIDPADLEIAHGRVPLAGSTLLWDAAARMTGNEALGLEVARRVRPA